MEIALFKKFLNKFSINNFEEDNLKEDNLKNSEFDNLSLIACPDNINSEHVIDLEKIQSIENGENILKEFNSLLGTLEFKNITLDEILIDNTNSFIQVQHEILGTPYIFINIEGHIIRIITEDSKCFLIDTTSIEEKVLSIIFTTHIPRKLCINSSPIFTFNDLQVHSVYDLSHIIRMFYNKHDLEINALINLFMDQSNENYNALAYNLFQIKDSINTLLEKNRLMKLINNETKILEIVAKCSNSGLPFNKVTFLEFKNVLNEKYDIILNEFEQKYDKKLEEKFDIISMCNDNQLPTTVNIDFLKSTGNLELLGQVTAFNLVKKYNNADLLYEDDRLYLKYNPYNLYGNIESNFILDNKYIVSDKCIVMGSYPDLYLRVFANISNIDYIIQAANENSLIETLSTRLFGHIDDITKLNTLCILKAYLYGHSSVVEMADFILDEMDTYIDDDGVALLQNTFAKKCPEILKFIDDFNKFRSFEKRHSLDPTTSINRYIKLIESDVFKQALIFIYDNIQNYNSKYKDKINIVGLLENKIVLETTNNGIDVAIDILNRNLSKAFEQYIKKVQVLSITSCSNKLTN